MSSKENAIKFAVGMYQKWFFAQVDAANNAEYHYSDSELAKAAGIAPSSLSLYRSLRTPMSLSAALKIGSAVGLQVEFKLEKADE